MRAFAGTAAKIAIATALTLPSLAAADWTYTIETDRMTGKEAKFATIRSANSLNLDFPYRGANHGTLVVRQHPKYGLSVILMTDKGQMLCRSYDDSCRVSVRFGTTPASRFAGGESGDHDPKVIFLRDAKRFIAGAAKANSILVQASFFHNGEQVFEFQSAAPLQWVSTTPAAPARTAPQTKAKAKLVQTDDAAPTADICPADTNRNTPGECGAVYKTCHDASQSLPAIKYFKFMDICVRRGQAAAQAGVG